MQSLVPWECPSDGAFAFNKSSCAKGFLVTARASQRFQRRRIRLLPRMSSGMAAWSKRPRTNLCLGPLAMVVPTATVIRRPFRALHRGPETLLGEINGDVPEADFGTIFGEAESPIGCYSGLLSRGRDDHC